MELPETRWAGDSKLCSATLYMYGPLKAYVCVYVGHRRLTYVYVPINGPQKAYVCEPQKAYTYPRRRMWAPGGLCMYVCVYVHEPTYGPQKSYIYVYGPIYGPNMHIRMYVCT